MDQCDVIIAGEYEQALQRLCIMIDKDASSQYKRMGREK
jgi:hypothetical protein